MKKEDGKKAKPNQEPKHEQTTNPSEVAQAPQPVAASSSQKDFLVAAMLSLFLGWFGVDRFYLGFVGSGILKLITFGGCGLWYLIDLILILAGGLKSADKQELKGRDKNLKIALIITGVVFAFGFITSAISSAVRPVTTNQSGSQTTQQSEQKAENKQEASVPEYSIIGEDLKTRFDGGKIYYIVISKGYSKDDVKAIIKKVVSEKGKKISILFFDDKQAAEKQFNEDVKGVYITSADERNAVDVHFIVSYDGELSTAPDNNLSFYKYFTGGNSESEKFNP